MSNEDDEFIEKLEELGEAQVRRNLAKGVYGTTGYKRPMVEAWLGAKVLAREDQTHSETIGIARKAMIAAWVAAIFSAIGIVVTLLV